MAAPPAIRQSVAVADPNSPLHCLAPNANGSMPAASDSNLFSNVTASGSTNVKTGAGFLHSVTVNRPSANLTVGIYGNTTGAAPVIGNLGVPATVTSMAPFTVNYDAAFTLGLTLVTSGTTDITVSYR